MIKSFDRSTMQEVRIILTEALNKIQKEHGVTLSVGTMRFTPNDFSCKLQGSVIGGADIVPKAKKYDSLTLLAFMSGYKGVMSDEDVNKEFKTSEWAKDTYIILGCSHRSSKYPIIAKDKRTGKEYKFRFVDVARGLGRDFKLTAADEQENAEIEMRMENEAEARMARAER